MSELRNVFVDCSDIVFHSFSMKDGTECGVVSVKGLSDTQALERQVIAPLLVMEWEGNDKSARRLFSRLPASSCQEYEKIGELADRLCVGYPVVLVDGASTAYSFDMIGPEQRSVEEPVAESTVRGPRDGFTESLGVNLPLIRKRLKTPDLKVAGMTVGSYSRTEVAVVYIKGIADPALAGEIKRRIEGMRIEGLLESESIEEWISDNPVSPFPQLLSTERPDVVCANLLEGRIAILIDGTPFALVAPVSLFSMLQSPEDYYQNILSSSFIRWLRYVFFVMSLLLPSAYVAITTYHQEMIPTVLLLNIAKSREEIPFPALVEALIMEITFEALREAGVRLPKQVGAAVSIVGALVIGQAATSAGIVSAPMVIVVAITGISSFMIPRYSLGIPPRILRFPIMILAGTLGLVGVMLGFILIVVHLSKLRSFGLPYLSPVTPTRFRELKDVFLRSPIWTTDTKPALSGSRLNSRTTSQTKGIRDDR
ncbi:spore germination protein [Cohnella faecalis]|uniref:Spore germination protein n=2 Tax=Cohnella faecalis TaxID=2315694 RepID=A0A398CVA5_9BACL|nr:spore germination protein [Cohnella faecalis]